MREGVLQDPDEGAHEEAAQGRIHCDVPYLDIVVNKAVLHCSNLTIVLTGH